MSARRRELLAYPYREKAARCAANASVVEQLEVGAKGILLSGVQARVCLPDGAVVNFATERARKRLAGCAGISCSCGLCNVSYVWWSASRATTGGFVYSEGVFVKSDKNPQLRIVQKLHSMHAYAAPIGIAARALFNAISRMYKRVLLRAMRALHFRRDLARRARARAAIESMRRGGGSGSGGGGGAALVRILADWLR